MKSYWQQFLSWLFWRSSRCPLATRILYYLGLKNIPGTSVNRNLLAWTTLLDVLDCQEIFDCASCDHNPCFLDGEGQSKELMTCMHSNKAYRMYMKWRREQ
jgi:hypothetical protein